MEEDEARARLTSALADRQAAVDAADAALVRLYEVVAEVAPSLKQVEIVRATGWSREHVRKIAKGEAVATGRPPKGA